MDTSYSVLMSVHPKENPEYLRHSIQSMMEQSVPPVEFVLVQNGLLTQELQMVIKDFPSLQKIALKENLGIGKALAIGLQYCKCSLVASMDSDDIAMPNRCELQLRAFALDPQLDLVGGQVVEFIPGKTYKVGKSVPLSMEEIIEFSKKRNPINHMTVMFKKESVIRAQNYQDCPNFEDYDLWIRMIQSGMKMCNLPSILAQVRLAEDGYSKRGGLSYLMALIAFQNRIYRYGYITKKEKYLNCLIRTPVAMVPNKLRNWLYMSFLRKKK